MVLQELGIAMMRVEMFDELCGTRPHEHIVRRVSQMVGETASEVSCTKDQDLGLVLWRFRGLWHLKVSRLDDTGSK